MKINKAWSLQPAIDWVLGWQVACMWGKEETQISSLISQISYKNNLEMFVSALFGRNQMLSEAEAKSAAHAFSIHTDTHWAMQCSGKTEMWEEVPQQETKSFTKKVTSLTRADRPGLGSICINWGC